MGITSSLSKALASVGAQYHALMEQQDLEARAAARQQFANNALMYLNEFFPLVLEIFYHVLTNCAQIIGAHTVKFQERCAAVPHVDVLSNGLPVFRFEFYFKSRYGNDRQFTMRIINHELQQECYARGIPQLVADVTIVQDSRALVRVAWLADVQALRRDI